MMSTLHDNLERKRRQQIVELNRSGACHLCGCTTGSRSFQNFVATTTDEDGERHGDDQQQSHVDDGEHRQAEHVLQDPDITTGDTLNNTTPMRTCMCYGNTASWPFSLRVCEMCIADDVHTGRIRCCGICGIVACDENCGVELIEVTDKVEWTNAGCLQCRGMESFSEMELFRRKPYPNDKPRATRVCIKCLELFSLFSFGTKYDFTCRYFKCTNRLIPSSIMELKRCITSFPLSEVPVELLDSIMDYLGGKELLTFGLVCSSMFKKVEHVSKDIVTRFNHQLPTGPIQIINSDQIGVKRKQLYPEGKNRQSLCPPEDSKTWVGVLNQMEQLTKEIYYFGFQQKDDDGAAMRFLRNGTNMLCFDRVYAKPPGTGPIVPHFDVSGMSVRGGQVLITRYHYRHSLVEAREEGTLNNIRSLIFATDKPLGPGIHRVLVRYYCVCDGQSLGTIGILRQEEERVAWATSCNIMCVGRMEEHVFGLEYNSNERTLQIYKKNSQTNKMEGGRVFAIDEGRGSLVFAAALSSGTIGIKGNQLSVRACSNKEWTAFLSHTAVKNLIPRVRSRSRRGEDRMMRHLERRLDRRARAMGGENNEAEAARMDNLAARIEEQEMIMIQMENDIIEREFDHVESDNEDDDDDDDDVSDFQFVADL